jgi:transcription initiation factor TFIIA large subunit
MSAPPHQQPMYAPQMPQMINNGSRIKSEPGLESPTGGPNQQLPYQAPILPPAATVAQQRAAMSLQANYGPRAAASINAIQNNMSQQQQQQNAPSMQQMQQQQYQQQMAMQNQRAAGVPQRPNQPQMTPEQYRHAMAQQAAQAAHRIQAQNGVNGAQTDGAGDEMEESVSVIKRMNANGEEVMGRIEIDGLIRDKIAAMGQSMEGGGLMLPLHQATNLSKRQRKVKKTTSGPAQHDGPGSDDDDNKDGLLKDEDLDEDAINSDLDDPDDALNGDEDDDETMGHIMLCMYDKVQRVKNKW